VDCFSSRINCSAVILAGGLNSRMGGRNKAFLTVGGKTILDRLVGTLEGLFEEILLVTRKPALYQGLSGKVQIVMDLLEKRSSLTGIHAGLVHSKADFAFVVPCDAPFIEPELVRVLLDQIEPSIDIIVPSFEDHYEPLCAVYSKRCIAHIEAQLLQDDFKILGIFKKVKMKAIPADDLRKADPTLRSFFNINTPEAYRASQDFDATD
jgi:molybdenum cofactor guanylyltransferase